jgi:hypothetical protein
MNGQWIHQVITRSEADETKKPKTQNQNLKKQALECVSGRNTQVCLFPSHT